MNAPKILMRLLEFAEDLDHDWRKDDCSCEAFPDLVLRLSSNLDLRHFGDLPFLLEVIDEPSVRATQFPTSFSDLHVNLFDNGRFVVEVLNWWGSDINIHDHDFSGVQFQLVGDSLNVVYKFDGEDKRGRLTFGKLSVARTELWHPGNRSLVRPGRQEPHIVNHIDYPTVSLLVRTVPLKAYGPQRNYFPPSASADYGVADTVHRKKVVGLKLLAAQPDEFRRVFRRIVAAASPTQLLFVLIKLVDVLFRPQYVDLLNELGAKNAPTSRKAAVTSAAYLRAALFLTTRLKWLPELDYECRLALSALASGYDQTSFDEIRAALATLAGSDVLETLSDIGNRLSVQDRQEFDNVFRLLNIRRPSVDLLNAAELAG